MTAPNETRLRNIQRQTMLMNGSGYTLSAFRHGGGRLLNFNNTAGSNNFLPKATGKGGKFRILLSVSVSGMTIKVKPSSGDVMQGLAFVGPFATQSNTNTITFNGSTTGGVAGTYVEIEDAAPGIWRVSVAQIASGTAATPFSNS